MANVGRPAIAQNREVVPGTELVKSGATSLEGKIPVNTGRAEATKTESELCDCCGQGRSTY